MSSENNNQSVQDLLNINLDAIVEEGQQKAAKKRKKTAVTTAIVAAICLVIAVVYVVINVVIPMGQYKDATKLLEQKEFQEAIDGFEALGDYKNSADMVSETKYQWAESLLAEKSYDEAYAKFKEIQDYSDAADRMKDVRYTEADDYLKSCAYLKAIELLERLGDYKDSQTRVLEANYLWAEDYLKQGQLEEALMCFEKAGLYKDAKARADEVYEMMQIHATAVKLSKTSLTINKGKTAELRATLEPADTTDTIVGWTSSDEKVATVDENGVVTATGYGTATIEVKTSNQLSATCKVTTAKTNSTVSPYHGTWTIYYANANKEITSTYTSALVGHIDMNSRTLWFTDKSNVRDKYAAIYGVSVMSNTEIHAIAGNRIDKIELLPNGNLFETGEGYSGTVYNIWKRSSMTP